MKSYVFAICFVACVFVHLVPGEHPEREATSISEQVSNRSIGKITTDKLVNIRTPYPAALSPNNTQCVCGQNSLAFDEWDVDVRFNSSEFNAAIKCRGTIIAHNLVVTSVKCLRRAGNRMDTHNDWQQFLNVTMVAFYLSFDDDIEDDFYTEVFAVKNITNNNGGVGASYGSRISAQDIAIIVVDGDLFQALDRTDKSGKSFHSDFRVPACIPKNDGNVDVLMKSVVHRFGSYHGITEDNDTKGLTSKNIDQLVILDGGYCDKEGNFGEFSDTGALCTRIVSSLPTIEGGSLLTSNVSGYLSETVSYKASLTPQTQFLVGICSVPEKRPRGKRIGYTYFANVIQNLEFIETVANEHGSMWCETPEFVDTEKATPGQVQLEEWPWEAESLGERSDTLDCACGLLYENVGVIPQAALLEDEIPPWVAKIYFSQSSNEPEGFSCIGTIINDRVIVTDADWVFEYVQRTNKTGSWEDILKDYEIYIGSSKLFNISDAKLVTIKNIIVHPGFVPELNHGSYKFELALLILNEPLVFPTGTAKLETPNNNIRPICLPKFKDKIDIKSGTNLTVWERGTLKETQNLMKKLQATAPRIQTCAEAFNAIDWETAFCREVFLNDTWNIVSGAPTAIRKPNGKYYQVGVDVHARLYISQEDKSKKYKVISVDVQEFLQFIEYYSNVNNAKWCKE